MLTLIFKALGITYILCWLAILGIVAAAHVVKFCRDITDQVRINL